MLGSRFNSSYPLITVSHYTVLSYHIVIEFAPIWWVGPVYSVWCTRVLERAATKHNHETVKSSEHNLKLGANLRFLSKGTRGIIIHLSSVIIWFSNWFLFFFALVFWNHPSLTKAFSSGSLWQVINKLVLRESCSTKDAQGLLIHLHGDAEACWLHWRNVLMKSGPSRTN